MTKIAVKRRIFSGMQPTNRLQLGNYLGALKNWVKLQDEPDTECIYCVVDLHANTAGYHPETLRQSTREVAAAYIAAGVDPARSIIFPQSAVAGHTQLGWMLGCMTPLGWLDRMTQFKDKVGKGDRAKASAGLYTYPVLMAADVLLYHATHVPVGDDQKQHVELMRDIAISFNQHIAGRDFFPLPEPLIMGEATRVMSLRDGTAKMSKSAESDLSRINLTDDADTIKMKIRKARTDNGTVPRSIDEFQSRPEAKNLISIYAALSNTSKDMVMAVYGGQQFSVFKSALSDLCVEKLSPITSAMRDLMADPHEIDKILSNNAERAAEIAEPVMLEAMKMTGFWVKDKHNYQADEKYKKLLLQNELLKIKNRNLRVKFKKLIEFLRTKDSWLQSLQAEDVPKTYKIMIYGRNYFAKSSKTKHISKGKIAEKQNK